MPWVVAVAEWRSGIAAFAPLAVQALALRRVVVVAVAVAVVFLCDRKAVVERVVLRIADVVGVGRLPVVPGIGLDVGKRHSTASWPSLHLWESAGPAVRVYPEERVEVGGGNN